MKNRRETAYEKSLSRPFTVYTRHQNESFYCTALYFATRQYHHLPSSITMNIVFVSCLVMLTKLASADVVLNENIMNLALQSAELSALAYDEDPPGEEYDNFGYFDSEPDQALAAKKGPYCFGAFRGTTMTFVDWQQNFNPGKMELCVNATDGEEDCCMTRSGFFEGYWTSYKDEFEASIRECAKTCSNTDECVVLTGHSQGGAIAAVAALMLADLNPYVITFGQPNTIDAPCGLAGSDRWYRFINTKENSHVGLTYDPVPFVPGLGADSFGHMMLLSNDYSGVAYIGLDAQDFFGPLNVAGFEAHSMISTTKYPGYLDRLQALIANATYPIRTTGYVPGSICTHDVECETLKCKAETYASFKRCVGVDCTMDKDCLDTGRCDSGTCLPKLGSCEPCDEPSDCAGGKCTLFRCSGSSGLMDNNCLCKWNSDCDSGRCEGFAPPQCEAQLGLGAHCDENSDCKSDYCSWSLICADRSRVLPEPVELEPQETSKQKKKVTMTTLLMTLVGFVFVLAILFTLGRKLPLSRRWGYQDIPNRVEV
jgi:hypothetical protein